MAVTLLLASTVCMNVGELFADSEHLFFVNLNNKKSVLKIVVESVKFLPSPNVPIARPIVHI